MYGSLMVIFMDQRIHHLGHEQHFFWLNSDGWKRMICWAYCNLVTFHRVYRELTMFTGREIHYGSSSKFPAIWKPDFLSSRLEWQGDAPNEAILISNSEFKFLDTFWEILSLTLTIEAENGGYDYRNVTCDFISSTYEKSYWLFLAINAPLHHLRHSLMPVKLFGAISADWTCHIQWHVWHT